MGAAFCTQSQKLGAENCTQLKKMGAKNCTQISVCTQTLFFAPNPVFCTQSLGAKKCRKPALGHMLRLGAVHMVLE